MTSSIYSRARKTAGEVGFWAVLICSIFVYPTELNELLGISSLLAPGELLNGPNDWTLLVRASLGLVVGVAVTIIVWKLLAVLLPMTVQHQPAEDGGSGQGE
ncbi:MULTISPECIES: hypothetical protein [Pseudomonas]|uniref:Uncharacterized protein n=1 Tax=Pseudomonas alloputida TaxID=1940621 RepID=A0ABY3CYD8_9PSED|nr:MULTISPECIES: hypothetical protein [Pseudomonas putida group]MCO6692556.1 hypothetical protein [Pseudomonas shirazica]MCZ9640599.1 hypothetical protein [Pseudomonas putida]TRZ57750.1 hypothetical protein DZA28_27990 [Pseudomonas alloputida]HEE9761669.1 hypothetical protein [Pseudomonas putida]